MIIKFEYKNNLHKLEVEDSETVLTLKLLISEMVHTESDKLIIKLKNSSTLTNESRQVTELVPSENIGENSKDNSNKKERVLELTVTKIKELDPTNDGKKPTGLDLSNLSGMDFSAMKPLVRDKKFMKGMLENNPMFKKTFENNPEMKAMMNSGELTDEIEKMIDDPEYMKEQMKNGELAMQKIENIPGGLSEINSYMEKVYDPIKSLYKDDKKKLNTNKAEEFKKHGIRNIEIRGPNDGSFLTYINEIDLLDLHGFKDLKRNVELLKNHQGDVGLVIESLGGSSISNKDRV